MPLYHNDDQAMLKDMVAPFIAAAQRLAMTVSAARSDKKLEGL